MQQQQQPSTRTKNYTQSGWLPWAYNRQVLWWPLWIFSQLDPSGCTVSENYVGRSEGRVNFQFSPSTFNTFYARSCIFIIDWMFVPRPGARNSMEWGLPNTTVLYSILMLQPYSLLTLKRLSGMINTYNIILLARGKGMKSCCRY